MTSSIGPLSCVLVYRSREKEDEMVAGVDLNDRSRGCELPPSVSSGGAGRFFV